MGQAGTAARIKTTDCPRGACRAPQQAPNTALGL